MHRKKISLIIAALLMSGCQTPFLVFPGKALEGQVATTTSFAFAEDYDLLLLETGDYSVILRSTVIDGELYIDAAPARRWGKRLRQSQDVRIKLGDTIYPATAVVVVNPDIIDRFLSGRTVYKIVPRAEGSQSKTHTLKGSSDEL